MKLKQISIVGGLTSLLVGCGLMGPTYHEPTLNTPTQWASSDKQSQIESTNVAELAWWQQFKDQQLNQLIESALSHNNNLQVAMGNMLQAQASLRQVNMGWVPTISLGGGVATGQMFNQTFNSSLPQLNAMGNNSGAQSFTSSGSGFIPSYTLNVLNQIKQGEIAKLNLAMQREAVNAVRLGLISQVSASYFTLLGLHKQYQLQQQLIADAKEMRKYNQVQYQLGSTTDLNLQGIDQFIASLEANLPSIANQITQSENALHVLTNQNPGKIELANNFDNIRTDGIIPVNLPSAVLKTRPDVRLAEYQLQIYNANIGAVTTRFFPSISLTGGLGQSSTQLGSLFTAGGDFWMTQLAATMPLLNLGLMAEIDKAKAGYYSAYYNYVQTVRTAFAEVDNGLATHDNLVQTASQQQLALDKANNMYALGERQYQLGALSYANTLGFKLNIDYSKANLNQLKIQQLHSIVNLYQALGGGYLVESQLTQVKKFGDNHDI